MVQEASRQPLRVVQWATGTVGAAAMRAVIDHPDMTLVGAKVYSEAKDGKDIGELCGREPLGIAATRDLQAIIDLKPDCVLYMPESTIVDDVCALLEAGINISTTRAEFFFADRMDPALRERVEAACQKGNSSIHASGSSPGFITEALPIVLVSLARRLDLLMIDEFANCIDGCSEEMLLGIMGFGESPEVFAKREHEDRDEVFKASLAAMARGLGIELDRDFDFHAEHAVATEDTKLHTTVIPAGSIAGQRVTVTGKRNGEPVVRFRSNWFVTTQLEPSWNVLPDGWRVNVYGDTPLQLDISFPMPDAERKATLPNLTAHRPVNSIPYICAGAPGLLTTAELPQVLTNLG